MIPQTHSEVSRVRMYHSMSGLALLGFNIIQMMTKSLENKIISITMEPRVRWRNYMHFNILQICIFLPNNNIQFILVDCC